MPSVLTVTDSIADYVNQVPQADKRVVRAVLQMMKHSVPMDTEEEASVETCPLCGHRQRGLVMQADGDLVWPLLARHILLKHKVWTPEHEAVGRGLLGETPLANSVLDVEEDEVEVVVDDDLFGGLDFDEIAKQTLSDKPVEPRNRPGRRRSPAHRRPRRAYRGDPVQIRSSEAPPPSSSTQLMHRPTNGGPPRGHQPPSGRHGTPPGYQGPPQGYQGPPPGYQGPPRGYQGQPQQQEGLVGQISGFFSNLFGGGQQQPPPGYGPTNGHPQGAPGYGPPNGHSQGGAHRAPPVGEWYPDPGLKARLVTQAGVMHEPGAVPAGNYQVEIFNGQSFVPVQSVQISPAHRYRLFSHNNRLQWGEL